MENSGKGIIKKSGSFPDDEDQEKRLKKIPKKEWKKKKTGESREEAK